MSRARVEMDRLRAEAWSGFADDLRMSGKRAGRAGAACAREHPVIILGVVSLLAALALWRLKRPPPPIVACTHGTAKRRGIASTLLRMGRLVLPFALSLASNRTETKST